MAPGREDVQSKDGRGTCPSRSPGALACRNGWFSRGRTRAPWRAGFESQLRPCSLLEPAQPRLPLCEICHKVVMLGNPATQ